jgi:hypothetical protein
MGRKAGRAKHGKNGIHFGNILKNLANAEE